MDPLPADPSSAQSFLSKCHLRTSAYRSKVILQHSGTYKGAQDFKVSLQVGSQVDRAADSPHLSTDLISRLLLLSLSQGFWDPAPGERIAAGFRPLAHIHLKRQQFWIRHAMAELTRLGNLDKGSDLHIRNDVRMDKSILLNIYIYIVTFEAMSSRQSSSWSRKILFELCEKALSLILVAFLWSWTLSDEACVLQRDRDSEIRWIVVHGQISAGHEH